MSGSGGRPYLSIYLSKWTRSTGSRTWPPPSDSTRHSSATLAGMDQLDMDSDENMGRPDLACPYCCEDHGVTSLVVHLEEEHPFEHHPAGVEVPLETSSGCRWVYRWQPL